MNNLLNYKILNRFNNNQYELKNSQYEYKPKCNDGRARTKICQPPFMSNILQVDKLRNDVSTYSDISKGNIFYYKKTIPEVSKYSVNHHIKDIKNRNEHANTIQNLYANYLNRNNF